MTATPLRGLKHANAFLHIYGLLKKHLHLKNGGYDPTIFANNVILTHYMRRVEEDPKVATGFSYKKGFNDESVRRSAQEELCIPVEVCQVVALRRFLASLFKNGRTPQEVKRIRRMFFGKIAGE